MAAPYLNRLSLPNSFSQPCIASLASPSAASEGPTEILDYMFLGSQQDALDIPMLKHNGITKIVNLSENCPRPECIVNDERHFLRIPIKDSYCAKLQPHFERAFEFIEDARRTNQKVLVHCLAGISRSATLAIAYVMRCKGLASDEAYRFVKARRPSISPNFNFMGQLLEYEKVLRDEGILKGGARPRSFNCPTLELTSVGSDATSNKAAPSSAERFLLKSASSDVISASSASSSSSSHDLALTNLENRKRTIDTPLSFPERPRQLMRNMRPQQSCRMQSVQEQDIPSPSTEFSKLDISLTNPCFGLVAAPQAKNDSTSSRKPFSAAPMLENPMFALISAAQTSAAPAMPSTEPVPAKKAPHSCSKKSADCCKKVASACSTTRTTKASFFRTVFRKGKSSGGGLTHSHSSSAIHSASTSSSTSTTTSRLRFRRLHARIPVDVLPTLHDAEAPLQQPAANNESQTAANGTEQAASSSTTTTYSPVLLGDSPESGFVDDYASSSMDSQQSPTASKSSSVGADALPAYRDPERESISSTSSLEIAVQ